MINGTEVGTCHPFSHEVNILTPTVAVDTSPLSLTGNNLTLNFNDLGQDGLMDIYETDDCTGTPISSDFAFTNTESINGVSLGTSVSGFYKISTRFKSGGFVSGCSGESNSFYVTAPSFSYSSSQVANPGLGVSAKAIISRPFEDGDILKIYKGASCVTTPTHTLNFSSSLSSLQIELKNFLSPGETNFSYKLNNENFCYLGTPYTLITPTISMASSGTDVQPEITIGGLDSSSRYIVELFNNECNATLCNATDNKCYSSGNIDGVTSHSISTSVNRNNLSEFGSGDHTYCVRVSVERIGGGYNSKNLNTITYSLLPLIHQPA